MNRTGRNAVLTASLLPALAILAVLAAAGQVGWGAAATVAAVLVVCLAITAWLRRRARRGMPH